MIAAWSEGWHRGVVGVAAARLARELHRPVLLLTVDGERATGSGRSAAGLRLHEFLAAWTARYERFGGHAQAVGMTVATAELEALRGEWEQAARAWLPRLRERRIRYDLALAPGEVDAELLRLVETLEPFGAGNDEPLFRVGPLRGVGGERTFGDGHLAFDVEAVHEPGRRLPVVAWRRQGVRPEARRGEFELLAALEKDRFRSLRLRLVDLRPINDGASD